MYYNYRNIIFYYPNKSNKEKKMKKTTEELLKILKTKKTLTEYFSDNHNELMFDSLSEIIDFYITSKHLKKSDVIRKSQIERHYAYQIISGEKKPSRDKLIMLCFGLSLTVDETGQMLKKVGYSELYPRDLRDSVIIFSIYHNMSIMDTNEVLFDMNLDILQ